MRRDQNPLEKQHVCAAKPISELTLSQLRKTHPDRGGSSQKFLRNVDARLPSGHLVFVTLVFKHLFLQAQSGLIGLCSEIQFKKFVHRASNWRLFAVSI